MPDVFSHCYAALEIINKIDDLNLRNEILKRKELYLLGAQGPDLFYYYHRLPLQKSLNWKSVGTLIHNHHSKDFFIEGLKYIKKQKDNKVINYDSLAYLLGFISHYAMDTNCHPFIYYFGGINIGNNKIYSIYHKELEMHLDQHLYNKLYNENIASFNLSALITPSNIPADVKNLIKDILKTVFSLDTSSLNLNDLFYDLPKLISLLNDANGFKKKLFLFLENKILHINHEFSSAIYNSKIDLTKDYLNLKKTNWTHPCDSSIEYNTSYLDCINQAILDGISLFNLSFDYLSDKIDIDDLNVFFPNLSYNTGLDLADYRNNNMVNFKCIFED